jgi:hypothetical protein
LLPPFQTRAAKRVLDFREGAHARDHGTAFGAVQYFRANARRFGQLFLGQADEFFRTAIACWVNSMDLLSAGLQ